MSKALDAPNLLRLDGVQFSFPFIFEKDPKSDKYRVAILIDKKDKQTMQLLSEALKYAYMEAVKNPKMWNGNQPKKWKNPIHDGDKESDSGKDPLPENAGKWYFNASSSREVPVIDTNGVKLTSDDEFFGGCKGSIVVVFKAYKEQGIGIAAYANCIIVTDNSTRFGGTNIKPQDAFADLITGNANTGLSKPNGGGNNDAFGFGGGSDFGGGDDNDGDENFNPWN